jgi:hypothetical protein
MKLVQFKITVTLFIVHCSLFTTQAQGPAVTSWLQNTTVKGSYYTSGNSTATTNNIVANCQKVEYSATSVYVTTHGVPTYPTGPFLDGNPSQATDQAAIFKFPLSPTVNSGTKTATTGGNIGVFINGVALFDYRDGVSWNNASSKLCGGPIQPPCTGDGKWNRDAIPAEKSGFDCSKGHPAMGNYHHHQNPSAFKLDKTVISTICNLYDADGLYVMNENAHSPLIGYAYDGFPIYGAYSYQNPSGTGGIVRMKSGYQLRTITTRTTYADGSTVTAGPAVSATYPLGYFREDYEYIAHPTDSSYLDAYNGRFTKTPEYPNGIYCYFTTVDANHNSAYPYAVGPTFNGVYANRKVTTVGETTTVYTGNSASVIYNCGTGTTTGTATINNSVTGLSFSIPYTQATAGASYNSQSISSTGVTGLTANLTAGTYSGTTGNLTFNVSGMPSGAGSAVFTIPYGTFSCTYTITVSGPPSLVVYNCAGGSKTGSATANSAVSGLSFSIPFTNATSGAAYPSQAVASTGVTGLTASLLAGTYSGTTGNLTFNVSGTPSNAGNANFSINYGTNNCNYSILVKAPTVGISEPNINSNFNIVLSQASEIIAIQSTDIVRESEKIELYDLTGKLIKNSILNAGQTISYIDIQTLYNGIYLIKISSTNYTESRKIQIYR